MEIKTQKKRLNKRVECNVKKDDKNKRKKIIWSIDIKTNMEPTNLYE